MKFSVGVLIFLVCFFKAFGDEYLVQFQNEVPEAGVFPPENGVGDAYTLGRLTGRGVSQNMLGYLPNDDAQFVLDQFYFQGGRPNRYNLSVRGEGMGLFTENITLFYLGLSRFDWTLRPFPGLRLGVKANSPSFGFVIGEATNAFGQTRTVSEFAFGDILILGNTYRVDYISKKGQIAIPDNQHGLAFFFGPLLNPGQFSIKTAYWHLLIPGEDFSPLYQFQIQPSLGITPNIELAGNLHLETTEELGTTGPVESWGEMQAGLSTRARVSRAQAIAGLDYASWDKGNQNQLLGQFHVDFLWNKRPLGIEEVRGNWDALFSNVVGQGEWLASVKARGLLSGEFKGAPGFQTLQNFPAFSLSTQTQVVAIPQWARVSQSLLYGVFEKFSVGQAFEAGYLEKERPVRRLSLGLGYNSIELRQKGPGEVSRHEYQFGYSPKRHELKIDLNYRLPLWTEKGFLNDPWGSQGLLEDISLFNSTGYGFQTDDPTGLNRAHFSSAGQKPFDVSGEILFGLSEKAFLAYQTGFLKGEYYQYFGSSKLYNISLLDNFVRLNISPYPGKRITVAFEYLWQNWEELNPTPSVFGSTSTSPEPQIGVYLLFQSAL